MSYYRGPEPTDWPAVALGLLIIFVVVKAIVSG